MGDGTALNVLMTADFKRFDKDLKQAGLLAEKAVGDIEDKFSKANPQLNLGASFIGGAAGGLVAVLAEKIANLPSQIIEANRELAKLGETARRVSLSTDDLQKIQFVGAQNGLSTSQTDSSVKGFASAIAGANEEGSKLGKLFADNGIKIEDAAGKQRNLNSLLTDSAKLFQGAASEQDKIDIAKLLGLSQEWIAILEKGPDAFKYSQAAAVSTGNIIDQEIIQKAKDFDTYWNQSFKNFETWAKSAAVNAASEFRKFLAVANLANDPNALQQRKQEYQAIIDRNGANSLKGSLAQTGLNDIDRKIEDQLAPALVTAKKTLAVAMASQVTATAAAADGKNPFGSLIRPAQTNTAALAKPAKAGSNALTDEEKRYNKIEDYIAQLEKTGRILEAERNSIGLSNAERAKALELARIGTVTDSEQLAAIDRQISANEALRLEIEKQKTARQGVIDATNFAGNALLDGLDQIIFSGGKAEDVIKNLTASLAKAALQAVLLGEGPLSKLFGTNTGSAGGVGGLLGTIISSFRASGGPVQAGDVSMVGENGPELVKFGRNGTVVPNSVLGRATSGTPGVALSQTFQFNGGFTFDQVRDEAKRAARIGAEQGRRAAISDMSQSDRRGTVR